MFDNFDANGDGFIDTQEYLRMLRLFRPDMTMREARAEVDRLDLNKYRQLSFHGEGRVRCERRPGRFFRWYGDEHGDRGGLFFRVPAGAADR